MSIPQKHSAVKGFLPALSGYRAIAAWLVFIFHVYRPDSPSYSQTVKNFLSEFHIGVDLFFVLSGFLIAYRYYGKKPFNTKTFFVNRFARIYPMYFLLTIAFFLVWYFNNGYWNPEKTKEAILSFTLTKTIFAKYRFAGIDTGWTLTVEELFYFSTPFFFALIARKKIWLYIIPFIILIIGVFLKDLFKNNADGLFQFNFSLYIFEFFTGIYTALKIKNLKTKPQNSFYTYFGILFLLGYLLIHHYILQYLVTEWLKALDIIILSVFGLFPIIYGLATEESIINKILSTKTMVLLGKSSYIFYLIHKGFVANFLFENITYNTLFVFILLNLISIALFKLVEEPLNNLIRARFTPQKTQSAA